MFLLPSLFTVGNLFCGYACVAYSMTGRLEAAAPFTPDEQVKSQINLVGMHAMGLYAALGVLSALTRARSSVVLWATPDALSRVLDRRVWRDSGLAARLRAIHG